MTPVRTHLPALALALAALAPPTVPAPAGPAGAVPAPAGPAPAAVLAPPPPTAVAPPSPVPVGTFGWPLDGGGVPAGGAGAGPPARAGSVGAVTRRFLPPPTPYGRGHRGVDLAGTAGSTVVAAGPGTVAFAGRLAGRGVVSVDHPGGLRTTYEPVTAAVAAGTRVLGGTVLGALEAGHRDCPVAACLHWGLRRPAGPGPPEYLDPLLLLGLGRSRLFPWPAR